MTARKSDSLWYPRYVGDYQRKTSHLSLSEHGAYALLLDHYYATGKPLPANAVQLQRVCRAFASPDVEAMHNVLREYFTETSEGYRNDRADQELLKRCSISEKRRGAAKARHANAGANAYANAGANAYTTTATVELTKVSSSTRAFRLPSDWCLPLEWREWTAHAGFPRHLIDVEAETFADYWQSKGRDAAKTDWFKTWKNWIRKSMRDRRLAPKTSTNPGLMSPARPQAADMLDGLKMDFDN